MNKSAMFSISAEDQGDNLGTVYSSSSETLRAFGAAYMRDPKTRGEVTLKDPSGRPIASFDVWQDKWSETAETIE
ncbi:MAG: hypothetical protein HEP70_20090 [Rhodobiaceae bacterium]|uniref:Uncharacterized protein n=1 Tax=Phaeobacter piscinae TaxID=1580596 RepID=A0ABM6PJI9_9RHOB|nr:MULTISPECIES: hypothetical protein [Rhodobacterales]ATG37974.1 hypothetical protein PhaeoP36_03898 [Phaeobacter piscinae]AUQ88495.1 hypothetical protein PhaeoP42_03899 [Phaeobacter piscinae]MCE8001136.1 hypothetical protein [Rhodobiaceae bacterium]